MPKTTNKPKSQPKPKDVADKAPELEQPQKPQDVEQPTEEAQKPIDPIEEAIKAGKEIYTFPAHEKDLYHVRMSLKNSFDPQTGKPTTKPFIQKFDQKMWHVLYDTYVAQGYNLEILYDPTKQH